MDGSIESFACKTVRDRQQHARVPLHRGAASLELAGETVPGFAEFLMPAEGGCIVAFRPDGRRIGGANFATDLRIYGAFGSREFEMHCPQCYVRGGKSCSGEDGWALISPVNQPASILYRPGGPAERVRTLLNNFDYRDGDVEAGAIRGGREGRPLRVIAGANPVEFRWRSDRPELRPLVSAGIYRAACLTEFTFAISPDVPEEQMLAFADHVAAICTFAAGQGCGVAVVELLDNTGAVVNRVVVDPIDSVFRNRKIIDDSHLPRLFRDCFDNYVAMLQKHHPWRRLTSCCGSIQDSPYLEQKFGSLMMALEFFLRSSLLEQRRLPASRVSRMDFPELIGAVKQHLHWSIPKHYTARDTIRLLRNAVMHGGELPTADSAEFRAYFDKWRLFLFRRVLIRLGYSGEVWSPHRGLASSSPVDDFSEEHNSFQAS